MDEFVETGKLIDGVYTIEGETPEEAIEEVVEELQEIKCPQGNLGGFMPNPPLECSRRKLVVKVDEIEYMDNVFCATCKDSCDRRKEYQRQFKAWRAYYRQNNAKFYKKKPLGLK